MKLSYNQCPQGDVHTKDILGVHKHAYNLTTHYFHTHQYHYLQSMTQLNMMLTTTFS